MLASARVMRAPVDSIVAPSFPKQLTWLNVAPLRMEKQARGPVLIEFWDFCRPASLRTLPYVRAWHERYAEHGLRVVSVHAPGFPVGEREQEVGAAVERLAIQHAVAVDTEFELWRAYDNPGWPARYLFAPQLKLFEAHHGEGDYAGTELAIQELLGVEREVVPLLRAADDDDAPIVVPTAAVDGAHRGSYQAGAVWVIAAAAGTLTVDGVEVELAHPGAHLVREHERHERGWIELVPRDGLEIYATEFEAGLAG